MGVTFSDPKPKTRVGATKAPKPKTTLNQSIGGVDSLFEKPLNLQQRVDQEDFPEIVRSTLPRLFEARAGLREGEKVSTFLDIISLPGRSITSLLGREDDESFLESLAQIEQEDGGFLWNLARDPATGASILTLPAGMTGGAAIKSLSGLQKLSALTGISIAEGLVSAGTTQAESMTKGQEFDEGQFGLEVGISAATPIGLRGIKALINGGTSLFARVAAENTGIPKKTLIKASTRKGRKQLRENAGREEALGEEVLKILDDPDKFLPERESIKTALDGMGNMELGKLRVFIERQKVSGISGLGTSKMEDKVNDNLDDLILRLSNESGKLTKTLPSTTIPGKLLERSKTVLDIDPKTAMPRTRTKFEAGSGTRSPSRRVKGGTINLPLTKTIPARDYKKFIRSIDDDLDYDKMGANVFSGVSNKMFTIRTFMKNRLEDRARLADPDGKLGYVRTMKSLHENYTILDDLDEVLGGKSVSRKQKSLNLMGNVHSKSNTAKKRVIEKLDKIFNQNFIERAELAQMAENFGPDGVPTIFAGQKSGKALQGVVQGAAVGGPFGAAIGLIPSMPAVATRGIGLADLVSEGFGSTPASTLGGLMSREVSPNLMDLIRPTSSEER